MKLVMTFDDRTGEHEDLYTRHIPFEYESIIDAEDDFNKQLNLYEQEFDKDTCCGIIKLNTLIVDAYTFYAGLDGARHTWFSPVFQTLDDWFNYYK